MNFKAKLRKIGNSQGIYIPKEVITGYNIGDMLEVEIKSKVITDSKQDDSNVITKPLSKKKFNTQWCGKHDVFKGSCGCL